MSLSHGANFWALFALGPEAAVCIATASAWAQCTFKTRTRTAPFRTAFSMASLVLTVKAAGWVYALFGGPPPFTPYTLLTIPKPLVVASFAYFVCNTALVATATM